MQSTRPVSLSRGVGRVDPKQIDPCHVGFTPTDEELDRPTGSSRFSPRSNATVAGWPRGRELIPACQPPRPTGGVTPEGYSTTRRHSALDYLSLAAYENTTATHAPGRRSHRVGQSGSVPLFVPGLRTRPESYVRGTTQPVKARTCGPSHWTEWCAARGIFRGNSADAPIVRRHGCRVLTSREWAHKR